MAIERFLLPYSEAAVDAIKRGASDYLAKPMSPVRLRNRMEQFLSFAQLRHRSLELEKQLLEDAVLVSPS